MNQYEHYQLAPDLATDRIINGMWQVAGGHGYIDHELAIADMMRYHELVLQLGTWQIFTDLPKILLGNSGVSY